MELIEIDHETAHVRLELVDLEILRSAIREASEALEDWEFETRMGCSREQLRNVAQGLGEIAEELKGAE